jgi:hypothetical protein
MNMKDLTDLATRLAKAPVPTQDKKLYVFIGPEAELKKLLTNKCVIACSILDAFEEDALPRQEESIPRYIQQRLSEYVEKMRIGRETSVLLMRDAIILARYKVPLTFLFDLVGDAHAIILQCVRSENNSQWKAPSYVHFDPTATTRFFEESLGNQCVYVN